MKFIVVDCFIMLYCNNKFYSRIWEFLLKDTDDPALCQWWRDEKKSQ